MKLFSRNFENGGEIPRRYTCDGENINPSLEWSDVPEGVKSFALIVEDHDADIGNFFKLYTLSEKDLWNLQEVSF